MSKHPGHADLERQMMRDHIRQQLKVKELDQSTWTSQQCDDGECAACQDDGECGCHCHPGAKLWDELTSSECDQSASR